MAEAWSRDGVAVDAIGPGPFRTELAAAVLPEPAARGAARTRPGRDGEPEDLDGPPPFPCPDARAHVMGQALMVEGGVTAG